MSLPDIARRVCAVALLLPLAAIAQSGPTVSSRAPEPLRAAVSSARTSIQPSVPPTHGVLPPAPTGCGAPTAHSPSLDLVYDRRRD